MAPDSSREWEIAGGDGRTCTITVGRGIAGIEHLITRNWPQIAILTQPTVSAMAQDIATKTLARLQVRAPIRVLPDEEGAKILSVVGDTYEWLNSIGFARDGLIVAVGGGALTDVAGFVAATYLRGVEIAYLPTTLLGAVDASIGGKTGVNVDGKNLVGVFRHPGRVVVDLDILDELPPSLLRAGSAEVVKAGFISAVDIIDAYETDGLDVSLDRVVPAAIDVKVKTVIADFREADLRAILNYGHTIGHGIEVAASIPHGHAVAIGMVAAGRIAQEALGFAGSERQRKVLEGIGLPTTSPRVDVAQVRRLMDRDKKRDGAGLRMVLLEDFGHPVVRHVEEDLIRLGLAEIGLVTG
jgi:3-dehydroquinate synthase